MFTRDRLIWMAGGLGLFCLGLGLGTLVDRKPSTSTSEYFDRMHPLREQGHAYDFIDPLLTCMFPESVELEEYSVLEDSIQAAVDEYKESGELTEVAYYFRDLNAGRWVGINEDLGFEPASLFKVPVMMAYFLGAENDPELLQQEITFTAPDAQARPNTDVLKAGQTYSIERLIELMITESDNLALDLLLAQLNEDALREIFDDLGVPYPDGGSEPYTISPRRYSLFFRVLYNGTYLSPDLSERALALMSGTTFDHGLTPVLPEGTRASHKFGERRLVSDSGIAEGYDLHDCGIIYYPGHPYFLCVFTEGPELEPLTKILGEMSELSYAEMQRLYPAETE